MKFGNVILGLGILAQLSAGASAIHFKSNIPAHPATNHPCRLFHPEQISFV